MKLNLKQLIAGLVIAILPLSVSAQSDDIEDIEAEISKPTVSRKSVEHDSFQDEKKDIQALNRLAPFDDIAVIQKRFLPKTNRFQAHLGLTQIQNNPYFSNGGMEARLGYFFSEFFGFELNYFKISTSKKTLTTDLSTIQGVKTSNLVAPKSYFGIDAVMVPIYGKIGWMNRKIIPFDFYFSVGAGQTTTSYNDSQAPTIHLGTGQIFALSKATAFRWDFSWNFYNSKAEKLSGGVSTGQTIDQQFNDLFLGAGFSWFFPEARYR